MALNPYFSKYERSEQTLVEDLVVETIKIHGHEVVYLFRESPEIDMVFGEDSLPSVYKIGKPIEMYVESVDGFEGEGDFIAKFGLEVRDSMKLVVSKRRWKQEFSGITGGDGPGANAERPREGDLLYFPLSKGIFEIKFVEHEKPFYQFGKNYVYSISCELATSAGDTFETDNTEIDTAGTGIEQGYAEFALDVTLVTGTGTYALGETVTQGNASAKVLKWTPPSGMTLAVLRLERVVGVFTASATPIVGADSGASWRYSAQTATDISVGPSDSTVNQNADFEIELDRIVDFTESNPFSEDT
jgi:hypothetical protein